MKLKEIKSWTEGDSNIVVTCPSRHHKGGRESTASLNIYVGDNPKIAYGYCRCWSCEFQCQFTYFVAECFECSEDFAKNWLITNFGKLSSVAINLGEDILIKQKRTITGLPKNFLDTLQDWHPYLGQRKISREVCELFKVKYDPNTSQIVFPCFDVAGNLLMAPRRSVLYKNFYLDSNQEKPVYCLDYIIKNNIKKALLCEGPFDTLTGYTYGCPTIGTFGNPSPSQIAAINKSTIDILYLGMDNDPAGRRMANIIKAGLSPRIITKDVKWPNGKKDPNELSYDEFWQAIFAANS